MIHPKEFDIFLREEFGVDSYFGVPDSTLQNFCRYLVDSYGVCGKHVVGVNEGNCVAFGAGRHLATGKPACVYMQNSGLGNAVNPILSLTSGEVYKIPLVFIVGWRGAPGEPDEPQHIAQGSRTEKMLELLDLDYIVLDSKSTVGETRRAAAGFKKRLDIGEGVAFLVRKGAFESVNYAQAKESSGIIREQALEKIISAFPDDTFFGTTGMTSREVFEIRERMGMAHGNDFLAVGSMGHVSAIALGAASVLSKKRRIWCLDGDGAALMHMGAMATIGAGETGGFIHVLLNNASHESVGKIPTSAGQIDFSGIARACGYDMVLKVQTYEELARALDEINSPLPGKVFIEVLIAVCARGDLGRPTIAPQDSKVQFMDNLKEYMK